MRALVDLVVVLAVCIVPLVVANFVIAVWLDESRKQRAARKA